MAEVEAAVNPDAILRDGHIFLRIYRPLSRKRDLLIEGGVHLQVLGALWVKGVKGGQGGAAETKYLHARWPQGDRRGLWRTPELLICFSFLVPHSPLPRQLRIPHRSKFLDLVTISPGSSVVFSRPAWANPLLANPCPSPVISPWISA